MVPFIRHFGNDKNLGMEDRFRGCQVLGTKWKRCRWWEGGGCGHKRCNPRVFLWCWNCSFPLLWWIQGPTQVIKLHRTSTKDLKQKLRKQAHLPLQQK